MWQNSNFSTILIGATNGERSELWSKSPTKESLGLRVKNPLTRGGLLKQICLRCVLKYFDLYRQALELVPFDPGRMCNPFVPISIVRFDKLISTFTRSTRLALIAFGFGLFALEIGIFRCCCSYGWNRGYIAASAAMSISHFLATCA